MDKQEKELYYHWCELELGDYYEAYQRWSYLYDKDHDKIDEVFKNCRFTPFEFEVDRESFETSY